MISASVGFQCPECVREGNKGVRVPRTVAGGVVRSDPGLVTLVIIGINVVLFLAVQGSDELLDRLVLRSFSVDQDGVAEGGWHRLMTAAFLHEQTLHISLNMLVLFLFGRPLEAQLGRVRFIATYLICALGGSTASYLFNDPGTGSLGASGAVFGLIGTLLVVERRLGQNPSAVIMYLGILLLPGLVIPNIDWRGHVGGLVTGALLGALYIYAPSRRRTVWHVGVATALTVALLVAVQVRTERLEDQLRREILDFGAQPAAVRAEQPVVPSGDNRCGELQLCSSGRVGGPAVPVSATAPR